MRELRTLVVLIRLFARQEQANALYFVANAVVLPGAVAYLATRIFPPGSPVVAAWLTGAVVLGAGLGAFSQMGFAVLIDRLTGRSRLLALGDVGRATYLASRLVVTVAWSMTFALGGFAAMVFEVHVRLTLGFGLVAVGAALANALFHGGLGALVGGRATVLTVGAAMIGTIGPLAGFISPVFYPSGALPYVGPVVRFLPLGLAVELLRAAAEHRALSVLSATVLSVFAVGALALGLKFMRWPT